jgi:hypothetical protein
MKETGETPVLLSIRMPLWSQHLLVLALVAGAAFVIIRGAIGTLKLRHGKIGSCCAKGCAASAAPKTNPSERIVFLPAELLTRKRTGN